MVHVAAARAELQAKGVEFVAETWDYGVCRFALFRDPDGNALILHRRYAPRKTRQRTEQSIVSIASGSAHGTT